MLVPVLIDPVTEHATPPNSPNTFYGPWTNGTNLYGLFLGDDTHLTGISMYKSTDQGNTWAVQDVAGEVANNAISEMVGASQFGTRLRTAYYGSDSSGILVSLLEYNMTSDLWTNPVSTTGAFRNNNGHSLVGAGTSAANHFYGGTYQEFALDVTAPFTRSDGSWIILWNGVESVSGTNYGRGNFNVYNGSSAWLTSTSSLCTNPGETNDNLIVDVVLGSGDRLHVIYIDYATKTLLAQTIDSTNTVLGSTTITTDIFNPNGTTGLADTLTQSIGLITYDATSNNLVIPFKDANNHCKVAIAQSTDTTTWSSTQVDTTINLWRSGMINATRPWNSGNLLAPAYLGTTGTLSVLFWSNNLTTTGPGTNTFGNTTLYQSINSAGTWQTPVVIFTDTLGQSTESIGPYWIPPGTAADSVRAFIFSTDFTSCYLVPSATPTSRGSAILGFNLTY